MEKMVYRICKNVEETHIWYKILLWHPLYMCTLMNIARNFLFNPVGIPVPAWAERRFPDPFLSLKYPAYIHSICLR